MTGHFVALPLELAMLALCTLVATQPLMFASFSIQQFYCTIDAFDTAHATRLLAMERQLETQDRISTVRTRHFSMHHGNVFFLRVNIHRSVAELTEKHQLATPHLMQLHRRHRNVFLTVITDLVVIIVVIIIIVIIIIATSPHSLETICTLGILAHH
jgi:hypothetical protein